LASIFTDFGFKEMSVIGNDNSVYFCLKNDKQAGCWWLTSVILATQEAEIRRIMVRSQPGQIVHETLSQKKKRKKEMINKMFIRYLL
jgi:hypothetical protein